MAVRDYFSEGYKFYFLNREKLHKKDPLLEEFIRKLVEEP